MLEFTWNEGELHETLIGTGSPSNVILPVAEIDDDNLVAWDMVTRVATDIRVSGATLAIGEKTFVRSGSQT